MKLKEFGPPGGGRASLAPPLDPPLDFLHSIIAEVYSAKASSIVMITNFIRAAIVLCNRCKVFSPGLINR